MDIKNLNKYAQLIVKMGVNLQKGEELYVSAPIVAQKLALEVVKEAYANGAKKVTLQYRDELYTKLRYQHETQNELTDIAQWQKDMRKHIVDKKMPYVSIIAEDPMLLSDIDAKLVSSVSRASREAFKPFYDATMSNEIRWTIAAHPSEAWAKKMFPDKSADDAINQLWKLIFKTVRLDTADPVSEWQKHIKALKDRADFINKSKFVSFRYKNSIGTDLTVGMPENYVFTGGGDISKYNIPFLANMPTEEIFSAPHKDKADGKLVSSMPLVETAGIVENFTLTFKDGKVVDYTAEKGYDILKGIIETDEGSARLGEIAMVAYDSPISKLNTLFYDTLFDENASCHFALGRAYPSCVKGGGEMTDEQLEKVGLNLSLEHVDFMIGTKDLSIVGLKADGSEVQIFKDGNFVI